MDSVTGMPNQEISHTHCSAGNKHEMLNLEVIRMSKGNFVEKIIFMWPSAAFQRLKRIFLANTDDIATSIALN
jgi:hypothetical protein